MHGQKNCKSETVTLVKTSVQASGVRCDVVGIVTRYRMDGLGFEGR